MHIPRHIGLMLLLAGLSATALAQMRNPPPASIYSLGGTQLGPPPASIYSAPTRVPGVGRGFARGFSGGFDGRRTVVAPDGHRRGHQRHTGNGAGFIPYGGYAYYGGYPYYGDYGDMEQPDESIPGAGTFDRPQSQQYKSEPSGQPVYELRPVPQPYRSEDQRYGEYSLDNREAPPKAAEAPAPEPKPDNSLATVLVFRDGHRAEIRNYAIMGDTVYLFAGERRKIPLSELDVEATVRENDDRGLEFQVPSNR